MFIYRVTTDQLYKAVCFCYLVKRSLSNVRYTSVTFYKVPEQHGHVYLFWLYVLPRKVKSKIFFRFSLHKFTCTT